MNRTEIGLSSNYDRWSLLIITFQIGLATLSSLAVAVAANSSDYKSANLTASSWIVEGNATTKLIPNCSDLCLRVDDTDTSFGVVVQHCQGRSSYELWSYNSETKTLTSAIANLDLCLDSTDYPSRKLHLSKCNSSLAAQRWTWDKLTMTLSTTTVNSPGNNYYLMGELYNHSYWGSGINVFDTNLGSSDELKQSFNGGRNNFTAIWSFVNYTDPLQVKPWNITELEDMSLVPDSISNLIFNSGFESCGKDPGVGFVTIATSELLYLCGWRVATNQVEYISTTLWQPQEGNYSLHLNSANIGLAGAIVQQIALSAGRNYTLSFYMSGNPIATCGPKNKTMQVEVSPTSLAVQQLWFDIATAQSENDNMGWQLMGPMGFTAGADFANVTFRSLTTGGCGAVIDNVTVTAVDGPLPAPWRQPSLVGDEESRHWKRVVLLTTLGVATVLLVILAVLKMRKQRRLNGSSVPSKYPNPAETLAFGGAEDSWDLYIPVEQPMDYRHMEAASRRQRWLSSLDVTQLSSDEQPLALSQSGPIGSAGSTAAACMAPFVKEWTWLDVQCYTRNFRKLIGEGGFSRVYLAKVPTAAVAGVRGGNVVTLPRATFVAVKIEKSRDRSREIFKRELSVVSRLRHRYLVNLLGFCNEREEGILIFEYMANGNLHNRLHPQAHDSYKELSWDKRMEIARRVAWALSYLHSKARPRVLHGDVKSANILLDNEDNAKLCDFGFARSSGAHSSAFHTILVGPHVQGSLGYLDPEYLEHGRLSAKSDMYSFGVLLLELITGLRAFDMHRCEDLPSFAHPYLKDDDPSMLQLIVDPRLGSNNTNELVVACHVARLCLRMSRGEQPTMADVARMLSFHVDIDHSSSDDSFSHQFTKSSSHGSFLFSNFNSPR